MATNTLSLLSITKKKLDPRLKKNAFIYISNEMQKSIRCAKTVQLEDLSNSIYHSNIYYLYLAAANLFADSKQPMFYLTREEVDREIEESSLTTQHKKDFIEAAECIFDKFPSFNNLTRLNIQNHLLEMLHHNSPERFNKVKPSFKSKKSPSHKSVEVNIGEHKVESTIMAHVAAEKEKAESFVGDFSYELALAQACFYAMEEIAKKGGKIDIVKNEDIDAKLFELFEKTGNKEFIFILDYERKSLAMSKKMPILKANIKLLYMDFILKHGDAKRAIESA